MPRTHTQFSHACEAFEIRLRLPGLGNFRRLVTTTAFSFWLAIEPCQSQERDIAFGAVRTIAMPHGLDKGRMVYAPRAKNLDVVVWKTHQETAYHAVMNPSLGPLSFRKTSWSQSIDNLYVADFNYDGRNDVLLFNRAEKFLQVFVSIHDSMKAASTLKLGFEPVDIVVGDLNNDKKLDLIFLDLKNQGIVNYVGDGRGGFKEGRMIAPENAVSKLALTHLNNDNIVDLVAFDWVKGELHLLYGVGRGRFLDQTVFPVEGELKRLLVLEKGREGFLDLLLVMGTPPEIQYWEGNGLGDFRKKNTVPFADDLFDVAVADVNNDQLPDLVTLHPGVLEVHFNSVESPLSEQISYACPDSSTSLFALDVNSDKRVEGLVLGKEGVMTVFLDGNQPQEFKDTLELATGLVPLAVWVGKANLDDVPDIALVNGKSSSLSFFFGSESGLLGQSSYPVAAHPRLLVHHSKTDSTSRFLISYPETKSLSFFSLNLFDNSSVNAVVPSDGESEVISTRVNEKGQVEYFCTNTATRTQDASLSYYVRIGAQTFLERSYRLVSPNALLGVTVAGTTQNSPGDLVYVFRTADSGHVDVGVAVLDSTLGVKERLVSRELAAVPDVKSYLWSVDLDRDDTLDLIVAFPETSKNLSVLKGGSNDSFGEPNLLSDNLSFADRGQCKVLDLDGDGFPDLVVNNQQENAVGWFRNKGKMVFEPWQSLASSEPRSHFDIGDLNRDGVVDLAQTFPAHGRLRILNGNMFWKQHATRKGSQ